MNDTTLTIEACGPSANRQLIARLLAAEGHIHVLIDNALEAAARVIRDRFSGLPQLAVYAGTELAGVADVGPQLITLPKDKRFLYHALRGNWRDCPYALLTSPRTKEELSRFFSFRTQVRLENYDIFLFRFQDVALLRPLLRSLPAQRAMRFFGPVENLFWPETDMRYQTQWYGCHFPSMSHDAFQLLLQIEARRLPPCWHAGDEEWKAFRDCYLEDVALVDLCRSLLKRRCRLLLPLSDAEIRERVGKTVAIAQSFGLESQADIDSFCHLELDDFPGMHQHPAVAEILRQPARFPGHKMYDLVSLGMQGWNEVSLFVEEYQGEEGGK